MGVLVRGWGGVLGRQLASVTVCWLFSSVSVLPGAAILPPAAETCPLHGLHIADYHRPTHVRPVYASFSYFGHEERSLELF